MDVVYPYRRSSGDVELRYSLRSLVNVPHGRVIVSGELPYNRFDVTRVVVPRSPVRYEASTRNIYEACQRAVQTDKVIVMNDDIFVLKPWTFRHEHRCTIQEYLDSGMPKGDYRVHIEATAEILKAHGIDDPLFFGLHTPTVYDRLTLINVVKEFKGHKYLLRTLYYNLFAQKSVKRDDVKVRVWNGEPEHSDVLSISDSCAYDPGFLSWIANRFPDKSIYETQPLVA